jgi:hypothetical protein
MAMRDLQRLEELSSATALGFWAEDVILALDRITRLQRDSKDDKRLLTDAAEVLDAAIERSQEPFAALSSAKGVAATDTALGVAENLNEEKSPEKIQEMLRQVAGVLREVEAGRGSDIDLAPAMTFFAAIGKHQLAVGNSVSGYSGGTGSWMAGPATPSFS